MNKSSVFVALVTIAGLSSGLNAMEQQQDDALSQAVARMGSVFPEWLYFNDMKTLSTGDACIERNNFKFCAVDPTPIAKLMPGMVLRNTRRLLAFTGIADEAGAQLTGTYKNNGNIVTQSYVYTPATGIAGTAVQFSVYYIEPNLPQGDKAIFEEIKKRDSQNTQEFREGIHSSTAKLRIIGENIDHISKTQLVEVERSCITFRKKVESAYEAGDPITAKYLSIKLRELDVELAAVKMKLAFLNTKARTLVRDNPSVTWQDIYAMMNAISPTAYTNEIRDEAREYKKTHSAHIDSNLKKY
jgi:hypothetical protein